MPKIPQFVYIEIPGGSYILHTREPFLIGRVWIYKDLQGLTEKMEELKPVIFVQMETHSISISSWAKLGRIAGPDKLQKIILEGMMDFFVDSRKVNSSRYYDKFKI